MMELSVLVIFIKILFFLFCLIFLYNKLNKTNVRIILIRYETLKQ